MSKNKIADAETLTRVRGLVTSRARTKDEVDGLFNNAPSQRKKDVKKMNELLVQAPAAQVQSPVLQKEASAPSVLAFFEKKAHLTDAQRRFPELLKAAGTETQKQLLPVKAPGKVPVRAPVSGGNA